MNNTDWDAWMKEHHVKIYTEDELRRKRLKESCKKMRTFAERHKDDVQNARTVRVQAMKCVHDVLLDATTRQKHDSK